MDVATITMDPADARQRYDEYRAALHRLILALADRVHKQSELLSKKAERDRPC